MFLKQWVDKIEEIIGTQVRIIAFCESEADLEKVKKAFEECRRIEKKYSRFLANTELAKLNSQIGEWVEVDEEFFSLVRFGFELNEKTEGAFDLEVKGILESWGYDKKYSFEEKKMEKNRSTGQKIFLKDGGYVKILEEIELGGLGKGYAIDRMADCLSGIRNFSINAGGDIFAKGRDFEDKVWRFLFEHPTDIKKAIGFVEVDGFALACSSPTKRKWLDKHHLVDSKKNQPADQMSAVYTQAKSALIADAYSTALFVLGFEKAKKMMGKFPVEAMLVSPIGEIFQTEKFRGELFVK